MASSSKRRKCQGKRDNQNVFISGEEEVVVVEERIIGKLPDGILCHVLLFLPSTKEAVRTSVLSKRWRHLWTSVPSIDIDDEPPKFGIVDTVLRLNSVSRLRKFRLRCNADDSSSRAIGWISAAVTRGVEELDLTFLGTWLVGMPPSLFTCKKLVILKLSNRIHLDVPASVSLPSLKSLRLRFLDLFCTDCSMNNFLDGCPVLEDLCIWNYDILNQSEFLELTAICVKSASLKSLTLHIRCSICKDVKFDIDTTNLERLHLLYHPSVRYNLNSLSSSVKLELDLCYCCLGHRVCIDGFVELMRKLSTAEYLVLSSKFFDFLVTQWKYLPMFQNLIHLELNIYHYSWQLFSYLLECSPKLVTLVVHNVRKGQSNPERNMQFQAPKCLISLEAIRLTGFRARTDEVEMVTYFLKNAPVLMKMPIQSFYISSYKHLDVTKKLLNLPRGSTGCQIAFD